MAGPRPELGDFVAVGVGLAFGTLGAGAQVGAQLVTVPDGIRPEAGQRLVRISTDPAGLGRGGFGGGLRPGCLLLRQPGGLFGLLCPRQGPVPVGLGGADPPASLGACLPDRGVPLGFCGGDPRGGVSAGRLDRRILVGFSSAAGGLACSARA